MNKYTYKGGITKDSVITCKPSEGIIGKYIFKKATIGTKKILDKLHLNDLNDTIDNIDVKELQTINKSNWNDFIMSQFSHIKTGKSINMNTQSVNNDFPISPLFNLKDDDGDWLNMRWIYEIECSHPKGNDCINDNGVINDEQNIENDGMQCSDNCKRRWSLSSCGISPCCSPDYSTRTRKQKKIADRNSKQDEDLLYCKQCSSSNQTLTFYINLYEFMRQNTIANCDSKLLENYNKKKYPELNTEDYKLSGLMYNPLTQKLFSKINVDKMMEQFNISARYYIDRLTAVTKELESGIGSTLSYASIFVESIAFGAVGVSLIELGIGFFILSAVTHALRDLTGLSKSNFSEWTAELTSIYKLYNPNIFGYGILDGLGSLSGAQTLKKYITHVVKLGPDEFHFFNPELNKSISEIQYKRHNQIMFSKHGNIKADQVISEYCKNKLTYFNNLLKLNDSRDDYDIDLNTKMTQYSDKLEKTNIIRRDKININMAKEYHNRIKVARKKRKKNKIIQKGGYEYIINPINNRKVNINSSIGKKILTGYLHILQNNKQQFNKS